MEQRKDSAQPIRFADFELDTGAGELRKAGVKLKPTGQPLLVLAVLPDRPGDGPTAASSPHCTLAHWRAPGGLKVFDLVTRRSFVLPEMREADWPTWSANSEFIYFTRPGDDAGVFRVRVSDGVEKRMVDLKGFRGTGALEGWFGLDPRDTPILIRDVGTADIYALTLEQK